MTTKNIRAQKFSTSVSSEAFGYLTQYQKQYHLKRSQALEVAIKLLQEKELAKAYSHSAHTDKLESNLWDNTLSDEIKNEAW